MSRRLARDVTRRVDVDSLQWPPPSSSRSSTRASSGNAYVFAAPIGASRSSDLAAQLSGLLARFGRHGWIDANAEDVDVCSVESVEDPEVLPSDPPHLRASRREVRLEVGGTGQELRAGDARDGGEHAAQSDRAGDQPTRDFERTKPTLSRGTRDTTGAD